MISANRLPAAVAVTALLLPMAGMAQADVASLEMRIAALEQQNARILEQLQALREEQAAAPDTAPVAEREAPAAMETVPVAVHTEGERSRLSFYGFARADAIFDDSRPSAAQTPTHILSEGAGNMDEGSFTLHPRLTRVGMNFRGPVLDSLGGARLSAKLETDFQNGGRESRAIPRYRHAYAQLDWDRSSLLIGQTWDIISPLYPTVNADTMMWNAGNLGDRRMQLRYTRRATDNISFALGLGLTGAVDSLDLDSDGVRDGEDAALPHLQGRIGYSSDRVRLGVWGHYAVLETSAPFNGADSFTSHSVGGDFDLRVLPYASIKGEFWTGSGLGDMRGGIGQTINTTTGREIDAYGGWVELGLKPVDQYSLSLGYTFDNPDDEQLGAGARALNRAWYITNQYRISPDFLIGIDYLHWTTDYLGLPSGTDNRTNLYSIYYF